ncbi:MAG: bifunctional demethylmenaquinone methyltransferase/2-methoxy-6-polyprenyl-1,4-benzoquinol methylase UbiE [Bacteroidetes bacterium]|nr:bifunctional demethylmenaquinone methyltransferase/2-methoxy-6-polyprenyl-1,4-benzoquinol methylase UbiE [Bacteroidota bacterium]MBT5528313.1 bifunctional demethylmenaquinone methyltransferase/2-methoxy-6-polyprenyl-1,4-benzoquinol methylase UbiE [Cytophagia bacterium]MBT3935740.1 bifunctional demethylmenaquinone methyltransferase/2-methoxy-6-polyprenyl-1,4-benzoquinol methylase UbiE [Bacteroidota bacterium]MBT4340176.1 bifunctional demethylmenaquinone methyltransferase/2-methoxy-6-polyprenyl
MNKNEADLAREQGKKIYVREMFNSISQKYDLMDRILSLGIDIRWRKIATKILKENNPNIVLDIATGTADLAIQEAKDLNAERIIGVDISEKMLEVGQVKVEKLKLDNVIELQLGDSENLIFEDNFFDAVSVSFGVRNFENLNQGLKEMHRVLKKDGKLLIMEFSMPSSKLIKALYLFYFNRVVPLIGRIISGNVYAYRYLPESVEQFPYGEAFLSLLKEIGFSKLEAKTLSLGICTIYTGIK